MNTPVWQSGLWFIPRAAALLGICIFLVSRIPSETDRKRLVEHGVVLQQDETGKIVGIEITEDTLYERLIEDLSTFRSIRSVRLKQVRCKDELVLAISQMPEVRAVLLPGCEVTDDQLKMLQRLELHSLDLSNTIGPVNGLAAIGVQENLKDVAMQGCEWVTDNVVGSLIKFPGLQTLDAANTNITDSSISFLESFNSLNFVSLSGCRQLSNETLEHLQRINSLRNVFVRDVPLSLSQVADFQRTRPEVILNYDQIMAPDLRPLIENVDNPASSGGGASTHPFVSGYVGNPRIDATGIIYALDAVLKPSTDPSVLKYLPQLELLTLSGSGVDDAAISHIKEMSNLKYLHLSGSKLSDTALDSLPAFNDLRSVGLTNSTISPAMLQWLSNLPKLTDLDLSHSVFADADFADSAHFPKLSSLRLSESTNATRILNNLRAPLLGRLALASCNLDDADLASIKPLPGLGLLDLSNNPLEGHGVKAFQKSPLQELCLRGSGITDTGLEALACLSNLYTLDLSGTSISGIGLRELSSIGIHDIDLSETVLSEEGVAAICKLRVTNLQLETTSITQSSVELLALRLKLWRLAIDGKQETLRVFESGKTERALQNLVLFKPEADCLRFLKNFTDMRSLGLSHCDIDVEAADMIASAPICEELFLLECTLSPEALTHISESAKISRLLLYKTTVTPGEIEQLRQNRPDLQIYVALDVDSKRPPFQFTWSRFR